jgi:hypothetical protein
VGNANVRGGNTPQHSCHLNVRFERINCAGELCQEQGVATDISADIDCVTLSVNDDR